jgi:hypothetical protein
VSSRAREIAPESAAKATKPDGEHLLPGFRHPVADLFKEWDWE